LRRELRPAEAACTFDCESLSEQDMVCVGVRLTRCQYARLLGLRCNLPLRFSAKHWRRPAGFAADERAERLGALLAAGLEVAFLQNTRSATAVLRWPDPDSLLPAETAWFGEEAFVRHAASSPSQLRSSSPACRRAFLQQSSLDEPFRVALLNVWVSEALLKAVDFSEHWRDQNDSEDWLEVSAEDLDREMLARQEEFDAFDLRRTTGQSQARSAATSTARLAPAGESRGPLGCESAQVAQEELARLGSQLSGFLARASGLEGVDAAGGMGTGDGVASPGDRRIAAGAAEGVRAGTAGPCARATEGSDSDSDGSGSELDVLGMEGEDFGSDDSNSSGDDMDSGAVPGQGFRECFAELDEQLAEALDAPLAHDDAESAAPTVVGLPLSSRHIKVHGGDDSAAGTSATAASHLGLHAMEHVLASYCAEHSLAPGPASLLLGELGLAATGIHEQRGATAASGPCRGLDSMD